MTFPVAQFGARTAAAEKLIVVDLGFLGDSVHLIPALWEIKRHYPRAQLHVLAAPVGAEVLRLAPCVDRAWAFPLGPKSPRWWRHWGLIGALRRERFDVAFSFTGADRAIILTALTGARWRLACAGGRWHFWNRWLIQDWAPPVELRAPVFEQRRAVLADYGFTLAPARFDLAVPAAARDWAAANVPSGAVHLSINASTHLKEWPLPHWVDLARGLLAQPQPPPLLASGAATPREQERLRQFIAEVKDARLVTLPPGLSIAQLAAGLSRCRLHVGADSGVLHLAVAVGTATVAIFREYGGQHEWLPEGPPHRHLTAPCPCAAEKHPSCRSLGIARCLAGISPAQVLEAIRATLSAS